VTAFDDLEATADRVLCIVVAHEGGPEAQGC
jgi:hypothetical protein